MARGVSSPPVPLPKVSFIKVQDDFATHPAGVHDQQARTYGYNDFSEFHRPDHYIRYIEPLESELAVQVEYDMDEQDQEWLDSVNNDRKKEQIDKVSYETFEIIMDRLEKEWFDLTKNLPKPDLAMPSEDSTCAICDDSEGENTNAIVFCDGCNLAVHQDCYGVPYIPEGQWLCRKCTVSPENPVSCILCPNEGGAFKQTVHGEWVHLLCAIWVPETRVANDVFMEPVTGVDRISKQRWKLKCSVCDIREGACIQCNKSTCFLAFHATCARKEKLLMPMKATQGSEAPTLACFCEKHLPKEQADAREAALAAECASPTDSDDENDRHINASEKSSKTARAYAKTYKPGPPLVPHVIFERILQYIGKINFRHKDKFVLMMCKYWSLKREARRGAPLLKRLHLEPWTASSGSRQQSDGDKALKLEYMKRLRQDLEQVRMLAEMCRKREARKLEQADFIYDVLSRVLFPHEPPLRMAFEKIMGADRHDYFKNPVSKIEVPDYYDIIKRPMCWTVIDQKLDRHQYWDLQDFKDDVNLVLDNALLYNPPGTPVHKAAQKIKTVTVGPILADLDRLIQRHAEIESYVQPSADLPVDPQPEHEQNQLHKQLPQLESNDISALKQEQEEGEESEHERDDPTSDPPQSSPSQESQPSDPMPPPQSPLGNLEPPYSLLDLLVSTRHIADETNLILSDTPIASLFNYEFPVYKPLPPPPPPPPPKPKKPTKKERKDAKRLAKQAELDSSPGFRAPRTRRAVAAAAAFEAEAASVDGGELPAEPAMVAQEEEEAAARRARKRAKRVPTTLPGHSGVPPMVDHVDDQQSFVMFDAGWILPPDQKRGGRIAVERKPLPSPRKRQRVGDREKSHLSTVSMFMAENETIRNIASGSISAGAQPDSVHISAPVVVDHVSPEPPLQEPMDVDVDVEGDADMNVEASHTHEEIAEVTAVLDSGADQIVEKGGAREVKLQEKYQQEEEAQMEESREDVKAAGDVRAEERPESEMATGEDTVAGVISNYDTIMESAVGEHRGEMTVGEDIEVPVVLERMEAAISTPHIPSEAAMVELLGQVVEAKKGTKERSEMVVETHARAEEEEEEEEEEERPRIIYIDTLDTPAIRRQKNQHRREERERRRAEEAAKAQAEIRHETVDTTSFTSTSMAGPSRLTRATVDHDVEMDRTSDLSSLSDLSDVEEEIQPDAKLSDHGPAPQVPARESTPGEIIVKGSERLEGGTLVWAKADTYPWWPAVVFEPDDAEVPASVLDSKNHVRTNDGPLHLVRFFDKGNTWQWLEPSRMKLLHEDQTLDEDLIAPSSKRQRWKNSRMRALCREAYRRALAEMETDIDGAETHDQEDSSEIPDQTLPTSEFSGTVTMTPAGGT